MLLEHGTSRSSAVIRAVKVYSADAVPGFNRGFHAARVGRRNARVRNHDIETAEVLDNFCYRLFDGRGVFDGDLVASCLDVEVFCDGGGEFSSVLGRVVPDGNLRSREPVRMVVWVGKRVLILRERAREREKTYICTGFS